MAMRDAVRQLPAYHFTAHDADVKLNQNESAYDLPAALKAEVLRRLERLPFHRYPEMQAHSLRGRLAALHHWPDDGVVVTAGSNVLIQCLTMVGALGRQVATVSPTFSVYGLEARLLGAELIEHPLGPDFSLPLAELVGTVGGGCGVAFVADPAAPTGNRFPDDDVARLADAIAPGWTLVIDEAYSQFSGRDRLDLVRSRSRLVSLRTFSKAFGLAGVRLGYALMDPELATEVQKAVLPFSVSALQLAAAEVVLDHPEWIAERIAEVVSERRRLSAALADFDDIDPFPSDANFVLMRTPDAEAVFAGLLNQGVLVRRQDHLPGLDNCLRVSVGTPAENDRFLAALAHTLEQRMVGVHGEGD